MRRPDPLRVRRSVRSCARSVAAAVAALGALGAFGALTVLPGCGRTPGKSVLIITLDTTRADHLGCYGYPLPTTPNLDALAEQGVLFEQAYAPMPQTLPSHATLFTGLPPRAHKALENAHVLGEKIETLAERLAERDYETAAFIGSLVMEQSTGIAQGFAVFDQPTGVQRDVQHEVERTAAAVTDSAMSWALAKHFAAKPFLMWAHYYDPHGPYEPLEQRIEPKAVAPQVRALAEFAGLPDEVRRATEAIWYGYDNELAYMDFHVGRLLKGLRQRKMLENTIVVVVGDHGEGLMEHGEKSHGATIYQEQMLVPLIVVLPDKSGAGTRVTVPVQMQDLLPTLLALLEIAEPTGTLPGLDLTPALRQGAAPERRPIFFERPYYFRGGTREGRAEAHGWGFGEMASVVLGDEKLIRLPPDEATGVVRSQLFDLAADPDELADRASERPDRVAGLSELLDEWLARFPVSAEEAAAPVISPEREEVLRAQGYTGQAPRTKTPTPAEPAEPAPAGPEGGGK